MFAVFLNPIEYFFSIELNCKMQISIIFMNYFKMKQVINLDFMFINKTTL